MGRLRNHMVDYMTVRGYSPKTIKAYTWAVDTMSARFGRSPLSLSPADLEAYFLGLRNSRLSEATIHLANHAIRFFYRIHGIGDLVPKLRSRGRHASLPPVLGRAEVSRLLDSCSDLKSRTIFSLIYSCGLRISEAINLKVADIDFERKTVFVRRGKSKKDRYTVLGDRMARLIREYCLVHSPRGCLFYSRTTGEPLSADSIRSRFRTLAARLGLPKAVRVHTLRHCFATHLLEGGANIVHIMRLLGHSNIRTTMVYLHVQSTESMNIQSPMDTLPDPGPGAHKQLEMFRQSA